MYMSEFESIEKLVREFGEENRALIENKLEVISVKIDDVKESQTIYFKKLDDLEKRMYKVESHPLSCNITPRVEKLENAHKNYEELDIPDRLLTVEQSLLASSSIKKWLAAAIGLTSVVLGIIAFVLKLMKIV